MNPARFFCILLLSLTPLQSLEAASLTTETFTAGANGWQGSVEFEGSWTISGGIAELQFADTGIIAIPSKGTLSNLTSATSGSFTGDYIAAGINLLDFRFHVGPERPSSVDIFWGDTTNVYFRSFTTNNFMMQTQSWHTISASLSGPDEGAWSALTGSITNFYTSLQNVRYIAIRIARSGTLAQNFALDDIRLARQPSASGTSLGEPVIQWNDLIAGNNYTVEGSTNLIDPAWAFVDTISPTGTTYEFIPAVDHPFAVYRILMP